MAPAGHLDLGQATQGRPVAAGLAHYSNQGVVYASGENRQALRAAAREGRVSRRGDCDDHAMMEFLWRTLETEDNLDSTVLVNRRTSLRIVTDEIETLHNLRGAIARTAIFPSVELKLRPGSKRAHSRPASVASFFTIGPSL